jgi:hypothetical protein
MYALVEDGNNGEGFCTDRDRGVWEALSYTQFCCEPKNTPKIVY